MKKHGSVWVERSRRKKAKKIRDARKKVARKRRRLCRMQLDAIALTKAETGSENWLGPRKKRRSKKR